MNERIFKLALKAMDFQGAVDIDTELKLTNIELEKFAQLIVQKCADIGQQYADGNYEVYNQILEHFGVEEE